jgi:capsular exopolysaccharide synthesis family protein
MKFPSHSVIDIHQTSATVAPSAAPLRPAAATPRRSQLLTLGDYLRACRKHWRFLGLIVFGGSFGALFITRFQTPVYRAETIIEVSNINPDFLDLRQATPVSNAHPGATDLLIDMGTQTAVLTSAAVRKNTIDGLAGSELSHSNWLPERAQWPIPGLQPASFLSSRALLDQVAGTLYVRRAGGTRLIRLQVDAPNPVLAADFANSLVREYLRANIAARAQIDHDAEDLTRGQLAAMRSKIIGEEESLQRYAGANRLIYGSDQRNISDDRIRQLQSDLLQARTELAAKDAARQLARSRTASALPAVINDANLRELQSQLIDLRRQEAELTTVYKPEHEKVQQIRAAASQLESEIQQETAKVVAEIEGEYSQAQLKEKTLASAYDAAILDTGKTSQAAAHYDLLKTDIAADLTAYQGMLSQAKDLNLAAALKATDLLVPQPAEPPDHRLMPDPVLNTIMGLFSSLVLGIAWIAIRENFDRNVRVPGDVAAFSGVAELGAISSVFPTSGALRQLRNIPGRLLSGAGPVTTGPVTTAMDKKASPGAHEPLADDFRGVAASLLWSAPKGPSSTVGGRVIVITSAAPGDGKTTITANLGSALARAGRSVLLIDGDVRRPALHTWFGLGNQRGLTDILNQKGGDTDADSAMQPTRVAGLSLLSSGSDQDSAIDLLFQPALGNLIALLRRRFDFILVDSPPMARCADTRSLANASDGVVLVARSRRTARESVRSACERLRLDGVSLLGVVLNDFKAGSAPYKYYA